jgi:TRAP transporter TAXI family solute receptor
VASPALAKTTFISVGTGGTGGIYYPYGGGVAEIWSKYVKGVKAVAEVTGASVENVKLAHKGETVVGEVMGDVAVAGFNGLSKFKGKKHDILSMAIMYPNLLQIVALKSTGITDINQVKGRSISTGSPGSGTNFMAEAVLKALEHRTGQLQGQPALLHRKRQCPARQHHRCGHLVGGTRHQLHPGPGHHPRDQMLAFTPEQTEKILAANKTYSSVELAGGVYRGIDQPVSTIGVWNVMICQASLDTEMVYKLAKALFEHNDYLQKIHPSAAYTTPENAVKYSPIPLHPGTIKYLEEKGIAVPDKLRP